MKIAQKLWTKENNWVDLLPQKFLAPPQLVLVFGGRQQMEDKKLFEEIRLFYPHSHIVGCSTAGEILADRVRSDSVAVTAILFEKTKLHFVETNISSAAKSFTVGKKLADLLPKKELIHAMVFSDGLRVNGTALVKGLNDNLPSHVSVTGGLVGDGTQFKKTVVGLDHLPEEGKVVLIGFFGTGLKVGYGSMGGWDSFGVERKITKSAGNVLYELDGKPALKLYKTYLGRQAKGLPSSGLLFPLRLHVNHGSNIEIIRTVLKVNESDQSLTFAGDMPEGATVTLMKANFERLIDGAVGAGKMSIEALGSLSPGLAILISCVGRKLVLKERVEEEIEAVRLKIGVVAAMTGFYSYGELCPLEATEEQCRLHNQTMTITTFQEDLE